jgi:hypothetical protein
MRSAAVLGMVLVAASMLGGCGASMPGTSSSSENLMVSPQNTSLTVGVDRVSVALLDAHQNPVSAAGVSLQILDASGRSIESRPLTNVGPQYGGIPVYLGVARFPDVGQFEYLIRGTRGGAQLTGHAFVTVSLRGSEVAVGAPVPPVSQPILGEAGVTIGKIDSGVPPDSWHDTTVAQGVAEHKPMLLYFGDPAYCPSKTCGPTRDIVEQLCRQFCGRLLFEHIETYYPAGPPRPAAQVNPAFESFGLQTDPWIYFVNAQGIVSDRYEGPVTMGELVQSAQGTLAGAVPAVGLSSA